jgi:hypothetical protein
VAAAVDLVLHSAQRAVCAGIHQVGDTHSVICWLMMSPWLIKSYVLTSNPMYPTMSVLFNTKPEFVDAMLFNETKHGLNILKSKTAAEFFGEISKNISDIAYGADVIFFLGIFTLVIAWFIRRKSWTLPLVSCSIGYFLFTMMWGFDVPRLFTVNYSVFIIIITLTIYTVSERVSYGNALINLIAFCLFVTFFQQKYFYLKSPNIDWFGQIALTEDARREWLIRRNIFTDDMFRIKKWIDENIPKEDELFAYSTGYLFYLERKYILIDERFRSTSIKWFTSEPDYIAQQLAKFNVKWVLTQVNIEDKVRAEERAGWLAFKEKYLIPVHVERDAILYQFDSSISQKQ